MLRQVLLLSLVFAAPALAADEIHWTVNDPTTVTIDWRGSNNTLRYGVSTAYGLTAAGQTPSPYPYSSAGPFYEARIANLLPGITYHYSIAGGPDHVLRTSPPAGTGFTVYVEGDVGDSGSYPRVVPVQSLIADGRPDLVLVVGDITYANAHGQAAVDQHFNDVMVWSQDAAYVPQWGNHEWDSSGDDLRNYKGRFGLPNPQTSPGAPSLGCCGEDWSWFDYGNVRFIGYPEPYTSASWSDWNTHAKALMDQAQANPAIAFIVTFGHRPAYSSGHHPGDPTLASYLDALGASHSKYVLDLNGHSHGYERTKPQQGVTHVTVGTGGASLEEDPSGTCLWLGGCPPPSWTAFRAMHHGALRLRFDATAIHGDMICGPAGDSGSNQNDITCASGDSFDSFVLGSDNPPVVSAPGHQSGSVGTALSVRVTARDPDGDPIQSLTADLSLLPQDSAPSFQVLPGDTVGTLSWTPDVDDTGSYVVPFRAQNALSSTASTTIHVTEVVDVGTTPRVSVFALESAVPNPSRGALSITYLVGTSEPVRLDLTDASGRVLVHRDLGSLGPGRHVYLLGRSPEVAPGLYWLRLTQARHTQVAKIAFLR